MGLATAQTRASTLLSRISPTGWVVVAMLIAAAFALPRLDNHLFWDDEANTALYARNLLRFGRITAWDGTNLIGYAQGGSLGEDLGRELRVPTLPAYVAAAAMRCLGENTFAARFPFVLAGVANVGLLAVWLRRHLGQRFPCWLPAMLMAVSPAMLLYVRNCRYYSLGVTFSLLVWTFWAPGRPGAGRRTILGRRALLRHAGAAIALVLLIGTNYLNAAVLLATLPLFFMDRRYRQPTQYVLLAILLATALVAGVCILATSNPLAADYGAGQDWLFAPAPMTGYATRFCFNLGWFLRDLGTHEFLPWVLLMVLTLPWLASVKRWPGFATAACRKARRSLPLALRGGLLLAVLLAYVLLVAAFLPSDMGKGPTAEMRYLVPLLAVGCALAGLALVILWRVLRPAAVVALVLLVGTNWLHLGFLVDRFDGTSPWWPPTLYRYVYELCNDYRSGNEAMVDLLGQLPAGTAVRIWPSFMVYPPMFYVPDLHYCDQLTETKRIRADLRPMLPDYLFTERARPEVVLVPAPLLGIATADLDRRFGPGSFQLRKTLREHFNYMSKPEIPNRFFRYPEGSWQEYSGMVVLVAVGSALEQLPAMGVGKFDAMAGCESHYMAASQLLMAGHYQGALPHYEAALRLNPRHVDSLIGAAVAMEALGRRDAAIRRYHEALALLPTSPRAHYNLAHLLAEQGETEEAETHYRAALAAEPNYPQAHINLASLLINRGKTAEGRDHLLSALRLLPPDSPEARKIRGILRHMR